MMIARGWTLAWMALAATSLAGCCCEPWGGCYPNGMNWCGTSCGELFWHEWFSIPPECCDPCDCCGDFTGPRLNDGLYSHGNDYHGWCEKRDAYRHAQYNQHQAEPVTAEPVQGDPDPAPTPVDEPYYEEGVRPMSYEQSSRDRYPARRAAYGQPMARGPRTAQRPPMQPGMMALRGSMQRPQTQRLFSAMSSEPVDSRGSSRTLARPPRTRLFSP